MLLRLRLYLRILKSKVLPTMSSRLRMGRRSAWEPGQKGRDADIHGKTALDPIGDGPVDGAVLIVGTS